MPAYPQENNHPSMKTATESRCHHGFPLGWGNCPRCMTGPMAHNGQYADPLGGKVLVTKQGISRLLPPAEATAIAHIYFWPEGSDKFPIHKG